MSPTILYLMFKNPKLKPIYHMKDREEFLRPTTYGIGIPKVFHRIIRKTDGLAESPEIKPWAISYYSFDECKDWIQEGIIYESQVKALLVHGK